MGMENCMKWLFGDFSLPTDHFVPLFGMLPKLGPLQEWGLELNKDGIVVNTLDYSTNVPGIYAVGDINHKIQL